MAKVDGIGVMRGNVLMLDFSLFCDIRNAYSTNRKTPFDKAVFSMIVDNQNDDNAIAVLLKKCDKATVENLMAYFGEGAPIQALLTERLDELKTDEKQPDIETVMEKHKKYNKSFYQYLVSIMNRKGFQSDPDFYNHIGMSRQTFAKIRKTNSISRNHALLMAVGLGLTYLEAEDFMENAGYAFRETDFRESIITYVMRNQKYTLYEMEEILLSFGEKTLLD